MRKGPVSYLWGIVRGIAIGVPDWQNSFAGGVLQDGLIKNQSSSLLRTVLAPKMSGLDNLAKSSSLPLHKTSAFSSVAVLVGSAGQAAYAAANAAMDAKMEEVQEMGLPGEILQPTKLIMGTGR